MSETFTTSDFEGAAPAATSSEPTTSTETTETSVVANTAADATTTDELVDHTADNPAPAANTAAPHEPPKERWDAILNNAREKAKAEVLEQYSWAKDIDVEDAKALRGWMEVGNRDPIQALDYLVRGIAQDQNAIPRLQQYLSQLMGGQPQGQPEAQPETDEMPEPDIPTDQSNGQPVVYSAKQLKLLLEWQARNLTGEFKKELAPFQQDRDAANEAQQKAEIRQQADAYATRAVSEIADKPGFLENREEITKVWSEMPRDGRTEGELLFSAYLKVVTPLLTTKPDRTLWLRSPVKPERPRSTRSHRGFQVRLTTTVPLGRKRLLTKRR